MTTFNDNVIIFVGDEQTTKVVLSLMLENYKDAQATLERRGMSTDVPSVGADASVEELAKAIRSACWDPVYLLDPNAKCFCTTDEYDFDGVSKVPDSDYWKVWVSFSSGNGVAADALENFFDKLPEGRYGIAAAFRYESDGWMYFNLGNWEDGTEYVATSEEDNEYGLWADDEYSEVDELEGIRDGLVESAEELKGTPQGIADSSLIRVLDYWLSE